MTSFRPLLVAALVAVASSSALAGGEFDPLTGFGPVAAAPARTAAAPATAPAGQLTRAEVRAEYLRARAEGELVSFDSSLAYAQAPSEAAPLARQGARRDTAVARRPAAAGL